jgi:hypothetical protein
VQAAAPAGGAAKWVHGMSKCTECESVDMNIA